MPNLRSIISDEPVTGYFILDSKHEVNGEGEYDKEVNFSTYLYKPRFFGKLKKGALFLYRLPGGSTVDRKFLFYGGGRIDDISEPDADGNVTATIKEGFRFAKQLKQGDPELEAVKWTSRTRKPISGDSGKLGWGHVFSQYGMNEITEDEFWAIVDGQNCIAAENYMAGKEKEISPEDELIEETPADDFTLELTEPGAGEKARRGRPRKVRVGRHIDYVDLQAKKSKIGELGELIAYNYIYDECIRNGIDKVPVHASKIEGDGLGYDIRSWDKNGVEIHNEIKTTTANSKDGFDITPSEIAASEEQNSIYRILRIYALDVKRGTAKICIYDGPISARDYELVPTGFKVFKK